MVQKASTNKRGGARNFKKSDISNVALLKLFESHLSEKGSIIAFQFGSYYNKPASNAVVGPELASMKSLIQKIVAVAPLADLKYRPMKDAFEKLLLKQRDLMAQFPQKDPKAVSSDLANSLMTICHHARRLNMAVKWEQAISKCTLHEISELKEIRKLFANANDELHDTVPPTQELLDVAESCLSEEEPLDLPMTQDFEESESPSEICSLLQEAFSTKPVPPKKDAIAAVISMRRPASVMKRPAVRLTKATTLAAPKFFLL